MDSSTSRPLSGKPCTEPGHTELVSAWCQNCETFVCIQGILSDKHKGHIFISLDKIAKNHETKIEQKKGELQKIEDELALILAHQLEIESKFNATVHDLNNEIDKRSQALQSEIESWKTKVKSLLQERAENNRALMTNRQDAIKEDLDKLRAAIEKCSPDNYLKSLELADEALQVKRHTSVYSPASVILTEDDLSKLDLDRLLGHVSDEESYGSDIVSDIKSNSCTTSDAFKEDVCPERIYEEAKVADVEILEHCQFQSSDVQGEENNFKMVASSEGGVWIACTGKRWVRHYDEQGNVKKQVLSNFDIYDISVNSKNELFASVCNRCRIKRKALFSWNTIIKTESRVTFGITITSKDEILVCLQGIDYAEVAKFSSDGKCYLQTIRCDQDDKEIFHRPRQVLEVRPTGDVLVTDNKTLVTLDTYGKVKKTWKGELDSDPEKVDVVKRFQPLSIAVTSEGERFVLDEGNKRIVVFDKEGDFFWNLDDIVMSNEMSGGVFDIKDQFWVICGNGAIHKAKLRFHRKK
ncbi:uncharacterized protein [Argopecten irradians]|uniref:uncharacterized protein n=1 Tax=Argopecten irradians TaxID=31199 RepID=UPI00371FBA19